MPGTDDEILSNIEKNSGDSFSAAPEPVADTQNAPPADTGGGTPAAKGGQQQTVEKAPPSPPVQTEEQKAEAERQRAQRNEKGDLVDANGNVIARHGSERRLYQNLERTRAELEQVRKELTDYKALDGVPARLGLSREDVAEGLTLTASFNRDPVGTAQTILAKALALGHSLEDIVGEAGRGTIQTNALRSMIDERLAPITQATERQKQQETLSNEVAKEMTEFSESYPDALIHQDVIASMMNEDPRQDRPFILAERAVYRLREWCAKNGFDYSQPLKPQVLARQQGANNPPPAQQQPPQQRVQTPQPPAMPNGRGNGAGPSVVEHVAPLPASSSWNSILEQVKQELGGFN